MTFGPRPGPGCQADIQRMGVRKGVRHKEVRSQTEGRESGAKVQNSPGCPW